MLKERELKEVMYCQPSNNAYFLRENYVQEYNCITDYYEHSTYLQRNSKHDWAPLKNRANSGGFFQAQSKGSIVYRPFLASWTHECLSQIIL